MTGADFREAATAISNALKDQAFPVIVADNVNPVFVPWTTVTADKASRMVVLGTQPGSNVLADRPSVRLELPATFNDLLHRLGYAGTPDALGAMEISTSGRLGAEPEPEPLPAPLPMPQAVIPDPEPVVETPAAVVIPAPPVEERPEVFVPAAPIFGAPVQADAAPLFGAPSGPAVDAPAPFTPAPAAPVFGAPVQADVAEVAPMFGTPAVATVEDPTPAPFTPAPVFGAPAVSPEPAPAAPIFGAAPGPVVEDAAPAVPAPWTPPVQAPAAPFEAPAAAPFEAPVAPFVAPAVEVPAPVIEQPAAQPWQPAAAEPAYPAPAQVQERVAPAERPRIAPRIGAKHGEVIISGAGKGGVGKSSTAICLAEVAAANGLQAILIDANRGQADIRKYLRLGDAHLPSAYNAYETGDPSSALLMPKDYAHLRSAAKLAVPDYGIVLGPPSELADPRLVTASVYGEIIDYARSIADIVIVDTQIIEAHRTDLWDTTLIPMLGGDAWFVAITDESSAGVDNLHERLSEMRRVGLNPARTLILASQFLDFGADEIDYFQRKFADLGSFVGNTGVDDDFAVQLNLGKVAIDSPSIRPAIDNILLRATGRADLFAPRQTAPAGKGKPGAKFGLFGKRKGA